MTRQTSLPAPTIEEAYEGLNLDLLRPLGPLVTDDPPTRKRDLLPLLVRSMTRLDLVRRLYESLDERGRAAVQEALYHDEGRLVPEQFAAKYGGLPGFGSA